jgi:hypothetical protein
MARRVRQDSPEALLAEALVTGGDGVIERQEARGQQEVVESESVPTEGSEALVSLGFELGDPYPEDPLFRPAKLPDGWRKVGSDHAMWSAIVDADDMDRVLIFYKAAFYDRRADCRVVNAESTTEGR